MVGWSAAALQAAERRQEYPRHRKLGTVPAGQRKAASRPMLGRRRSGEAAAVNFLENGISPTAQQAPAHFGAQLRSIAAISRFAE